MRQSAANPEDIMGRWVGVLALVGMVACGDKEESSDTAGQSEGGSDGATDGGSDGGGGSEDGAALYATYCAACHGADGTGASGPNLLDEVEAGEEAEAITVILEGDGSMPPIPVTEAEAAAIVDYILSL
jgi:mono/diheme cytochrome c family protein